MKKIDIQRFLQTIRTTEKRKQWGRLATATLIFPASVLFASHWISEPWGPIIMAIQLKVFFFIVFIAALGIAFPNCQNFLVEKMKKIQALDQSLNQSQQLYRNVVVLGALMLLLYWLGNKNLPPPLVWAFVAFCLVVALYDAYRWYRSWSEHAMGKGILSLGFAAFSTLAYAIARQEIADVVGVTPTNLTHTTLLVAILTIPVLISLVGGFIFLACMAASMVVLPFSIMLKDAPSGLKTWLFAGLLKTSSSVKYPTITKIFQVFFYAALGSFIMQMGNITLPHYETSLKGYLPAAIYHLDMYHGKECKLAAGEKLVPLGDSKFLIGTRSLSGQVEILTPIKCDDLPTR